MRQVYLPSEKNKKKPCRAAGYIQRPFAYQDVLPLVQKHSQHGARAHAEESFGGRRRGMGTFFETARRRRIQSIPGLLGPPFPTHRNNTTTSIPSSSPRKKKEGGSGWPFYLDESPPLLPRFQHASRFEQQDLGSLNARLWWSGNYDRPHTGQQAGDPLSALASSPAPSPSGLFIRRPS